jgi:hypothetical protein
MYSIYHFFASLLRNKTQLNASVPLTDWLKDLPIVGCTQKGRFPDLVLRRNRDDQDLPGGEFIELKESDSYVVSSFNSTVPTGEKAIAEWFSPHSPAYRTLFQRDQADPFALPIRQVYYLVRGRTRQKINPRLCLVHGSFFETIPAQELIRQAFAQLLLEATQRAETPIDALWIEPWLETLALRQSDFSQVRHIDRASVKARIRVMSEVNGAGNILQYPGIEDNSLSLVVPAHDNAQLQQHFMWVRAASNDSEWAALKTFTLHHQRNGAFVVFQTPV